MSRGSSVHEMRIIIIFFRPFTKDSSVNHCYKFVKLQFTVSSFNGQNFSHGIVTQTCKWKYKEQLYRNDIVQDDFTLFAALKTPPLESGTNLALLLDKVQMSLFIVNRMAQLTCWSWSIETFIEPYHKSSRSCAQSIIRLRYIQSLIHNRTIPVLISLMLLLWSNIFIHNLDRSDN